MVTMSAFTDDDVLGHIDVENVVPENQRATLRERWERIQENQMSSTMSSGARFVERTLSTTVVHSVISAVSLIAFLVVGGFTIRKGVQFARLMTSLKSGLKEMTLLMSGDTVLLIILGGLGAVEGCNAFLASKDNLSPYVFVPFKKLIQTDDSQLRF
jgi:hypothetical protein